MKTIEIKGTIYEVGEVEDGSVLTACIRCLLSEECGRSPEIICDHKLLTNEYIDCLIGTKKPTKEQLIKAFQIFYKNKIKYEYVDAESDFEPIVSQILEHWEDEDSSLEHL